MRRELEFEFSAQMKKGRQRTQKRLLEEEGKDGLNREYAFCGSKLIVGCNQILSPGGGEFDNPELLSYY